MRRPATLGLFALVLGACGSSTTTDTLPCDPEHPERAGVAMLFADLDGDGHGAGEAQPVCLDNGAAPPGWSRSGADCAPDDRAAFTLVTGYFDEDRDGWGTTEVSRCVGFESTPDVAERHGDCAAQDPLRWVAHEYLGVDLDRDGHFVPEQGLVCGPDERPPGYSEDSPEVPDCDDTNPQRHTLREYYEDVDSDGVGAGAAQELCIGTNQAPAGYAERGGDCAPEDPARFRNQTYFYRDADGDGAWVASEGTVCTGERLPDGYARSGRDTDCDDSDPTLAVARQLFVDGDGDGVGAGMRVPACVGDPAPSGWSDIGTDCDDVDPSVFRNFAYAHRDADGDGYTEPQAGDLCVGAEDPAGYLTAASAIEDCDDADPARFETILAYVDADGDGYGVAPGRPMCTDGTLPAGEAPVGADCAPADPSLFAELTYVAVDRDGDGASAPETGTLCTGGTLPAPFLATESGLDCDDTDPARFALTLLFDDGDGDGVGAGPWRKQCLGATLPAGTSPYGDDPDDADPLVSVDEDLTDLLLFEL